jgi:hypothetical protein
MLKFLPSGKAELYGRDKSNCIIWSTTFPVLLYTLADDEHITRKVTRRRRTQAKQQLEMDIK